ncbi:Protein kinase superfamily protein [Euphorbia peplus]|nr:Protein kinase superfamily protein [Euphorbia peplus]
MSAPLSASPLPSDLPEPPSPVDDNSTPPPLPLVAPFPSPLPPPPFVPDITTPPPPQIAPFASPPVTSPPPVPASPVALPPVNLVPPTPTSPVVLPPVSLVPPIPTPLPKPSPLIAIPTLAPPPAKVISTPIIPVSSSSPLPPKPPIPSKAPPLPAIPSPEPPIPSKPPPFRAIPSPEPQIPSKTPPFPATPPGLASPFQPVVSLPPPANSVPPLPPVLASPSVYSSPPAEVLPAPAGPNYAPSAPFPLESPITPISPVKSPALPLPLSNANLPVNPGKSHLSTELIIGFSVFGVFLLLVLGVFCLSYKKRRRRNQGNTEDLPLPKGQLENILKNVLDRDSQSVITGSKSALPIQSTYVDLDLCSGSLSYDELVTATDGFSEANLIGEGGFGYVHKGVLRGGQEVAIKQLKDGSRQGEREFRAEVEIISRVHHKHLVSLKGYCISGIRRLLVYEFVPNNTLEFHLHGDGQPVLEWLTRLKIAIGSAKGLAYLHEDCNPVIVHRDIKASNVLLDHNFEAKVSDFGLAKSLCDARTRIITHSSTQVVGTFGYLAPEYATSGKVTEKSDVYSYGVMLLELITGRPPISDFNSAIREALVIWARPLLTQALGDGNFGGLVDPRLQNNYNTNEMDRMVACAAACVRHSSWLRPRMSQVARALEGDISIGDLNEGKNPGHSNLYGSRYPTSSLSMPLESSRNGISRYSGTTSDYGLNSCSSSSNCSKEHDQQQTRG